MDPLNKPSLYEYAMGLVELRRDGNQWCGPCPICREGNNRFYITKDGQHWACRKCNAKGGDVIDLMAAVQGKSVGDILKSLGSTPTTRTSAPRERIRPSGVDRSQASRFADPAWQAKAAALVARGAKGIEDSRGIQYLRSRGISLETAQAFKVGAIDDYKRHPDDTPTPVIVMPWIGKNDQLTAIRFRRLEAATYKDRFFSYSGSMPVFFGGHLVNYAPSVVMVEGEFNACSVWQALRDDDVDVISFGGETCTSTIRFVWHEYRTVLLWMDSAEQLEKRLPELGTHQDCRTIISPRGMDANDILVEHGVGPLRQVVRKKLS